MKRLQKIIETHVMEKTYLSRNSNTESPQARTLHIRTPARKNQVWSKSVIYFRVLLHRSHDITQFKYLHGSS